MLDQVAAATAEQIKTELFHGRKLQAVKIYREATGQGLKESKDIVERFEAELRQTSPDQFKHPAGQSKGCFTIILATVGSLVVVYALVT